MTTLYIHIGVHKTGTTTIQNVLTRNADVLLANGVHAPDRLLYEGRDREVKRHHELAWTIMRPRQRPRKTAEADTVYRAYNAAIAASPHRAVVLSSEAFSKLGERQVAEFRSRLYRCDTKIVVYVRNQVDWVESFANQSIKSRGEWDVDKLVKEITPQADFYRKIMIWADQFGKENIIVRVYENTPNIVEDFMDVLEVGKDVALAIENVRTNPSLSAQTLEFKRLMNARNGHDRALQNALKRIQKAENWTSRANILSRRHTEEIIASAVEGNDKLWREFLPSGTPTFRFPDPASRETIADPLDKDALMRIAAGLWATQEKGKKAETGKAKGRKKPGGRAGRRSRGGRRRAEA